MAKKKQEVKLKEPVRIRFKQLANGNQSIYLDYYTGDVIRKENYVGGKRQYEFLKLYLIPEKTREDKAKNEATLALAKAIQSKRIVELQNDAHGFQNTNKSKANVIDYLMNMRSQSKERGSLNYEKTVGNTIRELKLFRGDYIAFRDIDKDFLNSFVDFLKQAKKASKFGLLKAGGVLSNNSVIAYYGVLRTAINRAYKEGIITVNPTKEFDFASKVKAEVSRREYLTIEELKRLIGTECKYEIMKQAFLFGCSCVELFCKFNDVNAVLSKCRSNWRSRCSLARRNLQFDVSFYFLCHWKIASLINFELVIQVCLFHKLNICETYFYWCFATKKFHIDGNDLLAVVHGLDHTNGILPDAADNSHCVTLCKINLNVLSLDT